MTDPNGAKAPFVIPAHRIAPPFRAEETTLAKEELLEFEGVVTEILPEARYRVRLSNDHEIIAYTAGRMKKHRIRTLTGDKVTVEVSSYDLDKGRLIFRHMEARSQPKQIRRPFTKRR